jgi:putative phosphoribosyl transferase
MFANRKEAGRQLADRLLTLHRWTHEPRPLILGLPRGGVIVAAEVAEALDGDLDICLVRKLGVPQQPELAFGALAEGGVRVLDPDLIRECHLTEDAIESLTARAQAEIERRHGLLRGDHPAIPVEGREVIVVDDGLATGATMVAALRTLRAAGALRVTAAVPVAPPSGAAMLEREADEVVCLLTPESFWAVGYWYKDFEQVEDEEVVETLARFRMARGARATS